MKVLDYLTWLYMGYMAYILPANNHINQEIYDVMPKLYGLDDYDGCMESADGVFCSLRVQLYGNNGSQVWNTIQEINAEKFKYFRHDIVHRGVCLSNKCNISKEMYLHLREHNDKQLTEMLEQCLTKEFVTKYNLRGEVSIESCKYKEEKGFTLSQWSYLFILVLCIVLCITGCFVREDETETGALYKILAAFSFKRNWKSLMKNCNVNEQSSPDYLPGIHGMRAIFMLTILIVHSSHYMNNVYCENPQFYEMDFSTSALAGLHNGASAGEQIIFCVSAFLMSYTFFKDAMKKGVSLRSYPKLVLKRWLRFTPVHIFVIGYIVLWSRYINGDYPLLKLFYLDEQTCSKYWWSNLLYISNWDYERVTCIVNVWFLSVDFQLYCIMTFILIVCWKLKRFTKYILGGCLMISMFTISCYTYIYNYVPFVVASPEVAREIFNNDISFKHFYSKAYSNSSGYIVGVIAGYLYFVIDKRKDRARIITWLERYSTLSIQMLIFLMYSALPIVRKMKSNDEFEAGISTALYASFTRFISAFGSAVLLLAMAFKTQYFGKTFYENKAIIFIGSVSYSTVMVHLPMYAYLFSNVRMRYITNLVNVKDMICCLCACNAAGTLVYFIIEMPFYNIQKIILNGTNRKTSSSSSSPCAMSGPPDVGDHHGESLPVLGSAD